MLWPFRSHAQKQVLDRHMRGPDMFYTPGNRPPIVHEELSRARSLIAAQISVESVYERPAGSSRWRLVETIVTVKEWFLNLGDG